MAFFKYPFFFVLGFILIGIFMLLVFRPLAKSYFPVDKIGISPVCPDEVQKDVLVPIEQIVSGLPIILPQDDKNLIDYIRRKKFILPPSKLAYNLTKPNKDPSAGQDQFIQELLKNMTNGFFIECGALDGEKGSNTLFMEMHLEWKGLLIEGDPKNFALLKKKNRKAWTARTCLSIKEHPHKANFLQQFNTGKVLNTDEAANYSKEKYVEVQCMPLFSLLAAINVTTVDYFSLDVEGNELEILKTIPFDKVFIRTLSVEYTFIPEGKDGLINFMKSKDYSVVGEVHKDPIKGYAKDVMFAHKDVK